MKFIFAMLATAVLAASPAMAADDGGFYVGAGVGSFGLDIGSFDGNDTGFKVLGGYGFNEYFGLELEYIEGGSIKEGDAKIDVSGFVASLMGTYPVTEKFDLYAKLGMMFWDVDFDIFEDSGSDSGEDFAWGLGAGYDFTENFGARLEYQAFKVESDADGDMISAVVVWKF